MISNQILGLLGLTMSILAIVYTLTFYGFLYPDSTFQYDKASQIRVIKSYLYLQLVLSLLIYLLITKQEQLEQSLSNQGMIPIEDDLLDHPLNNTVKPRGLVSLVLILLLIMMNIPIILMLLIGFYFYSDKVLIAIFTHFFVLFQLLIGFSLVLQFNAKEAA